jgi:hypothetical protein
MLSRTDGVTRPRIQIAPANSIFITGNLDLVSIGYALYTAS